jgi:gliding motility-associated-like protein
MNRNLFFKSLIISLTTLFTYTNSYSQLVINQAMTPAQLVQNVLVGAGVTVSAVSYTGSTTMIGSFTNGNTTNLGLTSGVLLTTGNATNVAAPVGSFMSDELALAGDADLEAVSPTIGSAGTNDASVLEFDFVPLSDTLSFRYVFASEEYPEYVCSNFNDVFGFFVTGPNPAGGNYTTKNIALIPSTTLPVAINSVNNGSPGTIANGGTCINANESTSYTNLYVDNEGLGGTTIVFDGFTTVLRAWCLVTPCQSYHIKLAVADVGDQKFDSGVFLDAYSFSTNGFNVTPTYSNSNLGNNAIEACSDGIFAFTTSTPQTTPLTINYTVSGTATNGIDYTTIPLSVTIPVGSDSVAVIIHPLSDALTEGTETVQLNVTNVCATQTYSLNIMDNLPFSVTACPDITICPTNSASLSASATGGVNLSPYQYNWNPGGGSGTPVSVTPPITPGNYTYVVTATDYCSQTATDNVVVTVSNNLSISVLPLNPFICLGGSVPLTASGSATSYSWSPNIGLSATTGATVTANPASNQTYTVTGSNGGCTGSTQVTVNVGTSLNITVNPNTPSICPGANVALTASGGSTYSWSPSASLSSSTGTTVTASPTSTTIYSVTGTDASGCTGSTTVTVNVSPITASAVSTDENCGHANGTATVTAGGNCSSSFTYLWNTSPVQQTATTATGLSFGTYTVTVHCGGCSTTTTATVNNLPGPSVSIPTVVNATCGFANGSATPIVIGGVSPFTYQWNSSPVQYGQILSNVIAGTYNITVTDANQCTAMNTVTIPNIAGPTTTISNIIPATCGLTDGSATAVPNGGTPLYSYLWSSIPQQINQIAQNLAPGNYTVTVSDANSCTATTNVTISETGGPAASTTSTDEICDRANGTATVVPSLGSGSYTYSWSTTPTQVGSTAINLAAGSYTVTVDDGSCTVTSTVNVMNIPGPTAGFTVHPQILTILDGPVAFTNNSSGNIDTWQWTLGDGSTSSGTEFSHHYDDLGTFLVTLIVTDDNGCKDTAQDTVLVKEIFTLYIPNVFTPNGDGLNDLFTPYGLSVDPDNFSMQIFDRWGNMVFNTNKWLVNSAEAWNGTKNNKGTFEDVTMDVYVYRIKLKELLGPKHEYFGRIALIP